MTSLHTLFTTIDDRIELLPYFMEHYARLGATRLVIGLWNGEANPVHAALWECLHKWTPPSMGVEVQCSLTCDYSHYCGVNETPWLNEQRALLPADSWYSVADLDEFYSFPLPTYSDMIEAALAKHCMAVTAPSGAAFVDRIAPAGFPAVPAYIGPGVAHCCTKESGHGLLDSTFPLACDLSRALGCGTAKVALAKQPVTILPGHHYTFHDVPCLHNSVSTHHFKWNANVSSLLLRRHLAYHAQALPHAPESSRFMELFMRDPDWRSRPDLNVRAATPLGV